MKWRRIEKGDTKIMLMNQTRIVVAHTIRKKLLEREHLAHSEITRLSSSIRAGIEADVKWMVEACEQCQLPQRAQRREPNRPALEQVSWVMQAMGIHFFKRHGRKYLLPMDHFSGLPMYDNMGKSTDTDHTVRQLKEWSATFGVTTAPHSSARVSGVLRRVLHQAKFYSPLPPWKVWVPLKEG